MESPLEVDWADIVSENVLTLPDATHCLVHGAASPRAQQLLNGLQRRRGESPILNEPQAITVVLSPVTRILQVDLDDDLVLAMPHRFNDLELIVGSRGTAHWISTGNGQIRSLITLDTHVGGAFVETAEGPSLSKY